jgi:Fe-S-cluster containining protein
MADEGLGADEAGNDVAKPRRRRGAKSPLSAGTRAEGPQGAKKPQRLLEPDVGVTVEGERVIKDEQPRVYFNCSKCPAFCCSIYERVKVTKRDITRLAKHFGVSFEVARARYTRDHDDERVLKRVDDAIFPETCIFLDQRTRGCTVYHARPGTCRGYPGRSRCAYYDLLQFERKQQDDENVVPIVTITFREVEEEVVSDEDSAERIQTWKRRKR